MTHPQRRWIIHAGCVLLTLLAAGGWPLWAQKTAISKENQVKAVYLFNFVQFVKWPSGAFAAPDEPFCIGILGEDPFDDFLDETVKGEKIDGHPLVVRRYSHLEDVKHCQILFISRSESGQLGKILQGLRERTVLTVGDTDGFTQNGGVIRFLTEKNKIHLAVNLEAAKHCNLAISSKLLRLAEIVGSGKE